MVFRIQKRVSRGQTNTVGIKSQLHREAMAKAIEAASVVPYPLFLNGAATADTFVVGFVPGMGAKAYEVYVQCTAAGTNDATVDVKVDGVSILSAVVTVNATTLLTGTLTAAAVAALAAGKKITVVTTVGATPPTDLAVGVHLKTVHDAV